MRPDGRVEFALDSNLLLLYVVGIADRRAVARHKALKDYSVSDFDLLRRALGGAARVIAPPHVLTETSNHARQGSKVDPWKLANAFRFVTGHFEEVHVEGRDAVQQVDFERLGLTDSVLLILASRGATLVTADGPLHLAALAHGYDTVDFKDLRAFAARPR